MKITKAQLSVLRMTHSDGWLTLGGIDGRRVRKDVVLRLYNMGLLTWHAPHSVYEHSQWELTDAGKAVLGVK